MAIDGRLLMAGDSAHPDLRRTSAKTIDMLALASSERVLDRRIGFE
jgi:hypothetical protein